jgi:outer membrane lipoprotein-sorting protein
MNRPLLASFALAVTIVAPLVAVADVPPAGSLPAWDAFKKANESIKDYTETVTTHEVSGNKTEERVYHFFYQKPNYARSEIVSGPGSGGAAVWQGGDKVKGHQGGFISGIKLVISIHDGRATDLRGKTIDAAFFPSMISNYETLGKISESPGQPAAGGPTDDVTMVPTDPSKVRDLTKEVIVISRATHLPIEHLGYQGTQVVEDEHFTDQKINPGLPPSTFEM